MNKIPKYKKIRNANPGKGRDKYRICTVSLNVALVAAKVLGNRYQVPKPIRFQPLDCRINITRGVEFEKES